MIARGLYIKVQSRTLFKDVLKLFKHKKYLSKDGALIVLIYDKLKVAEKKIVDSMFGSYLAGGYDIITI